MHSEEKIAKESEKKETGIALADAARLIGHFTPHYRVVRSLGRGGFGHVFLAEDDLKKVAVKIIPLAFRRSGPSGVVMDNQENAIIDWVQLKNYWTSLNHASLVRIRDYFQFQETDPDASVTLYGLVYMDYWPWQLEGCIKHLQKEKCYTPARKRALLLNLAESLHRFHQETGLLVTDLKSAHFLFQQCRQGPLLPGVIDVGGLYPGDAADRSRGVDITPTFMAPELVDKKTSHIDETVLVYSFGLMGFFILEGSFLFHEVPTADPLCLAIRKHHGANWSPEVRQSMPDCVAIIEHCLREDPRQRLPTFAALVTALQRERDAARDRGQAANISLVKATLPRVDSLPVPGTVWREPVAGLELVWIPPGTFMMGQSDDEKELLTKAFGEKRYADWFAQELPRHRVELDGFWMGRVPVTRSQWQQFAEESLHLTRAEKMGFAVGMGNKGWGKQENINWLHPGFKQDDSHPAVCLSWFDAQAFVAWLSQNSGVTYTLPTEAQWEYACRAGTETPFHFGAMLHTDFCNTNASGVFAAAEKRERRRGTTPVGMFPANAFGLHDMHGNVWEWCDDAYDSHMYSKPAASQKNPCCREQRPYRVRRGGAWIFEPAYLRSSYRSQSFPDQSSADGGFRLVTTLAEEAPRR
ncbi:MAG: SUMF1/EgtB/PvdO family nonheme iron enzyme [Magnetococcales bacterium]|nr:SUMF1/EgtB/PvdO family nonheme iron enzyme [Magnetococcales bacterium]